MILFKIKQKNKSLSCCGGGGGEVEAHKQARNWTVVPETPPPSPQAGRLPFNTLNEKNIP